MTETPLDAYLAELTGRGIDPPRRPRRCSPSTA